MHLLIKSLLSLAIILTATAIGRRFPSLGGLVSVMPLTGALALVWTYVECKGDPAVMGEFSRGALWGLVPTVLFFLVAFLCFKRGVPLSILLPAGFGVWLAAALVHQWVLR